MREEWIHHHSWAKKNGQARDRTINSMFSCPVSYLLELGVYCSKGLNTLPNHKLKSHPYLDQVPYKKYGTNNETFLKRLEYTITSIFYNFFKKTYLLGFRIVLKSVNPFPNKLWFLSVCSISLLKTSNLKLSSAKSFKSKICHLGRC